jgi:NADH:ubiquinone oxidoreductase subunit 2 (subunit N)
MGYFILASVCFSFLGLRAFFVYGFFYFLINFFFFFFFQNLINETLGLRFLYINQLSFLYPYRKTALGFFFFIFIFSLIGIPPFLGF